MAAHHQLLYHIVFSVKDRRPLLQEEVFRNEIWAYMAGVANKLEGFALKIGGYHDHAHLLVRIPAKVAVSEFVVRSKPIPVNTLTNPAMPPQNFIGKMVMEPLA